VTDIVERRLSAIKMAITNGDSPMKKKKKNPTTNADRQRRYMEKLRSRAAVSEEKARELADAKLRELAEDLAKERADDLARVKAEEDAKEAYDETFKEVYDKVYKEYLETEFEKIYSGARI
jgi:hypothetical protein